MRTVMAAGWRLVVEAMESLARIGKAHRLARHPCRQRDEGLQRNIQLGAKAAAGGGRHDAHLAGFEAHDLGHAVAIHVGGLGAGINLDALAHPARIARFGLDIGVLDKTRFHLALDHLIGSGEGFFHVAALHQPAGQEIAGAGVVQQVSACGLGLGWRHEGGQRGPCDGEIVIAERFDGCAIAHHRGHCLAAKPRHPLSEHRLVGKRRDHPETVASGNIGRRQHPFEPRAAGKEVCKIAKFEAGVMMGRADDFQRQAAGWRHIVAKALRAVDLGAAVDPHHAGAHRRAGGGFGRNGCKTRRRHDGAHDLAVTGAAA